MLPSSLRGRRPIPRKEQVRRGLLCVYLAGLLLLDCGILYSLREIPEHSVFRCSHVGPVPTDCEDASLDVDVDTIPNIVHIVLDMGPQSSFGVAQYVAVKSAHDSLQPDNIFVYFDTPPGGDWYELAKPFVTPVLVTPYMALFGQPVDVNMRAAVVALKMLYEKGGILFPSDTVVLQSTYPLLSSAGVVLSAGKTVDDGIVMARPRSMFIKRWLASYKQMQPGTDQDWFLNTVPSSLAATYPADVTVMSSELFSVPEGGLDRLLRENAAMDTYPNNYAVHFPRWGAQGTTLERIWRVEHNFHRLARRFLPHRRGQAPEKPITQEPGVPAPLAAASDEDIKMDDKPSNLKLAGKNIGDEDGAAEHAEVVVGVEDAPEHGPAADAGDEDGAAEHAEVVVGVEDAPEHGPADGPDVATWDLEKIAEWLERKGFKQQAAVLPPSIQGSSLLNFKEEQLKRLFGPVDGSAIFTLIDQELKPTP